MFRLAVTHLFKSGARLSESGNAVPSVPEERPEGDRLSATLRKHDTEGEIAIALGQAGICCFVLLLHVISQFGNGWQSFNMWVVVTLVALIATSALRYIAASLNDFAEWLFDALNIVDLAIFLFLIWSYQYAYQHPAGSVLKAPSLMMLFVLIAMRALKSSPRSILVAGITSVVGWCLIVLASVLKDGTGSLTRDYNEFISSNAIMIGAEAEKVIALAALTVLLALTTQKARKILSQAAHATDYAEALDAAQRNLTDAQAARKTAEQALAALDRRDAELVGQNERFNVALENMSQGLCMFDGDKKLLVCNDRYIEMYDLPPELAEPGTPFRRIIEHRIKSGIYCGNDPEAYIRERLTAVEEAKASTKLHELNSGRVVAITHRPMEDGGWLATHEDITELQRVQAQVHHMARHDPLTDLPNRGLLREKIEESLKHARRGRGFAVLSMGLDRFKSVNDTYGHPLGDELLKAVAQRLSSAIRETDAIARLGGDEFAILQQAGDQPQMATLLASRLSEVIKLPFEIEGNAVVIDGSIGIAIAPNDGGDADKLLKSADMALYKAKSDGRGVYRFYEQEMDARMTARRAMELDLREGLRKGQFDVHYQPILNLQTREISGCEALLRWTHPDRGAVPPSEFIPLAEEIGLIDDLGSWVIQKACEDAAGWPHRIRIAVNLSPTQFKNHDLVTTIVKALSKSQLAAIRLELEITESVLLQDSESTLKTLHKLRDLGVRIAMDDFGTGYSSLSYLRSFPFDKIKIDRSFVRDLSGSAEAAAIIRSVTGLASSLGMITTAEGVETADQLRQVHREGCTEIQGYICSPPRPASEISAMLFDGLGAKDKPDAMSA